VKKKKGKLLEYKNRGLKRWLSKGIEE
jgi:hypothetical protein